MKMRRIWFALLVALVVAAPATAFAAKPPKKVAITAKGRPEIKLNRLDFPAEVAGAGQFKKFLRNRLKRLARRATWGAGRNNVIEYRFSVTELIIENDGEVLRVRCTAVGKLPGGQAAKSHLTYGGNPAERNKVVQHVLDIVAGGVVTRLSELERIRRGNLTRSRVRAPTVAD